MKRRGGALLLALALAALAAGCGGGGEGEDEISAYCDRIAELQAQPDPTVGLKAGDLEGAQEALVAFGDKIDEVARVAPPEISADLRRLQRVYADFTTSVQGIEEPKDALAVVGELQTSGKQIQAITGRLTAYTKRNCGEEPASG